MQSFNYRNILCKTKSWPWCAIAQCHVNELCHGITKFNYPAGISNLTEVKNILEIEHLSCYKFNSMTEVCWVFHHGKFTKYLPSCSNSIALSPPRPGGPLDIYL